MISRRYMYIYVPSLVPRPFLLVRVPDGLAEKGPGTHCSRMRQIFHGIVEFSPERFRTKRQMHACVKLLSECIRAFEYLVRCQFVEIESRPISATLAAQRPYHDVVHWDICTPLSTTPVRCILFRQFAIFPFHSGLF